MFGHIMKRFLCLLVIFLYPTFVNGQDTVRVALGDWPPFTSSKKSDSLIEQIITEAFKRKGIKVDIDYFPWKRSYELVRLGQYDLTYPWYKTQKRESEMLVSNEPVMVAREVFVIRKNGDFDWSNDADLQRYRIAGTRGYLHVDVLRKKGIAVDVGQSDIMNLKKLFARRVDAMPISDVVANRLIYRQYGRRGQDLFDVHPKPLMSDELFALFNKDHAKAPYWRKQLDRSLVEMKANGRYQEILSRSM